MGGKGCDNVLEGDKVLGGKVNIQYFILNLFCILVYLLNFCDKCWLTFDKRQHNTKDQYLFLNLIYHNSPYDEKNENNKSNIPNRILYLKVTSNTRYHVENFFLKAKKSQTLISLVTKPSTVRPLKIGPNQEFLIFAKFFQDLLY